MKRIGCAVAALLLASLVQSQTPSLSPRWTASIRASQEHESVVVDVACGAEGCTYAYGMHQLQDRSAGFLWKLGTRGETLWLRTVALPASRYVIGGLVRVSRDGTVWVLASARDWFQTRFYVNHFTAIGVSSGSYQELAEPVDDPMRYCSLVPLTSGDAILGYPSLLDGPSLVRIGPDCNVRWKRPVGIVGQVCLLESQSNSDSSVLVMGGTTYGAPLTYAVSGLDLSGTILWSHRFGDRRALASQLPSFPVSESGQCSWMQRIDQMDGPANRLVSIDSRGSIVRDDALPDGRESLVLPRGDGQIDVVLRDPFRFWCQTGRYEPGSGHLHYGPEIPKNQYLHPLLASGGSVDTWMGGSLNVDAQPLSMFFTVFGPEQEVGAHARFEVPGDDVLTLALTQDWHGDTVAGGWDVKSGRALVVSFPPFTTSSTVR